MNTGGLTEWIQSNIIPVLILVIGAGILLKANKGDVSKIVTILAGVLVALAVIGLFAVGGGGGLSRW